MGLLDRLRGRGESLDAKAERVQETLKEKLEQAYDMVDLLQESVVELELAIDDEGWRRIGNEGPLEFSRGALERIIRLARIMFLKNPLIRRPVMVQSYYVFGQGVEISANNERVNDVLQDFMEEKGNRKVLFSSAAQSQREIDLQVDGNLFFALFTNTSSGEIRIRRIPTDEIRDIITNPDDREDVWFYKRMWTQRGFGIAGPEEPRQRTAYYADWQGVWDPSTLAGIPIEPARIMHIKVGGLADMRFGVPDVYAALDWAKAYKEFLEDWASIVKSLQRFAYKASGKKTFLDKVKEKFSTKRGIDTVDSNPPPVAGSTALVPQGGDLTPIPKSGATISAEDGRHLRTMIAAATDMPDSILANDPQQGALATAKTLDRPTELAMRSRQMLWQDFLRDLATYIVERSKIAPNGRIREAQEAAIKGADSDDGSSELDTTVEVNFPPILERDLLQYMQAIVAADQMKALPQRDKTRMVLVALDVQDVDEVVDLMYPEGEPEPEPPTPPTPPKPDDEEDEDEDVAEADRLLVAAVQELTKQLQEARS